MWVVPTYFQAVGCAAARQGPPRVTRGCTCCFCAPARPVHTSCPLLHGKVWFAVPAVPCTPAAVRPYVLHGPIHMPRVCCTATLHAARLPSVCTPCVPAAPWQDGVPAARAGGDAAGHGGAAAAQRAGGLHHPRGVAAPVAAAHQARRARRLKAS